MGKFDNYEILTTDYKVVNGTGIALDVLLPKNLRPGKCPLIIRFHGGGWVTGSSLYEPWFPPWVLDLATEHNGIVISPNYRLLPESTGLDIMSDIESAWEWIQTPTGLAALLKTSDSPGLEADLERILTTGDSAGGYLSIQLSLSHSKSIRVCSATYPGIDFQSPPFSVPSPTASPPLPLSYVSSHLSSAQPGQIVSADDNLSRFPLIFAMMQQGTFLQYMGDDPSLYSFERIRKGEKLPTCFILHGKEDKVAPVGGSVRLVDLIKRVSPDVKVHLELVEGEDHGLDVEWRLGHQHLKAGLELVIGEWLR